MQRNFVVTSLLFALFSSQTAHAGPIFGDADPPADRGADKDEKNHHDPDAWRPGFGARVGGYGFRRSDGSSDKWDDCRMNGFGVFGTLDLNRYFFGELGFDFYHALPADAAAGMDRVSTHALAAVGLRMFPEFVVTPYVELGGGTEFTGIDNGPNHVDRVYPLAFIGIGAEINVTRELKLGANARFLGTMQVAESQSGTAAQNGLALKREALTAGQEDSAVPTKWGLAAQGQFFVRYAL